MMSRVRWAVRWRRWTKTSWQTIRRTGGARPSVDRTLVAATAYVRKVVAVVVIVIIVVVESCLENGMAASVVCIGHFCSLEARDSYEVFS